MGDTMKRKFAKSSGKFLALLLASLGILVLTPFVVFPEIMGDLGPRSVPLWRNCVGIALLVLAAAGVLYALAQMARARRKESRG